jgi:hypothetical protein
MIAADAQGGASIEIMQLLLDRGALAIINKRDKVAHVRSNLSA